jgi:hypothetical protein
MLKHRYTKQDCIEAIKRVATELDKSPSQREYNKHSLDSEPSAYTVGKKFDCWNQAKQKAELKTGYTKTDCLKALRRIAQKLDKSPSRNDYNNYRLDSEPSRNTVKRRFNGWNQAKRQAGLQTEYTRRDCLEALERVATKLDGTPSVSEYREYKLDSEPSTGTIRTKFDCWNQAKKQAGLKTEYTKQDCIEALNRVATKLDKSPSKQEYNQHRFQSEPSLQPIRQQAGLKTEYTKQDCLESLERVAQKLDKSPSQRDYREYRLESEPSISTIKNKFDCWNVAKKQCGLRRYNDSNRVNYPYGSNWYRQRQKVLERDKCCQSCQMTIKEHQEEYGETLHVHHLYKLRLFFQSLDRHKIGKLQRDSTDKGLQEEVEERTRKANHMSNLVTVCRECHASLEQRDIKEQVNILNIDMPEVLPNNSK